MTSSAHIIHAQVLASTFSWKFDLNKWKIWVFIGFTIRNRAACGLTVWHTACCTVHNMLELLGAVAMQQVREKCIVFDR